MPDLLTVAADAASPAPRRLAIVAYTGGPVRPGGWPVSVFSYAGMDLPATVPLLANHENALSAVVGHGTPALAGNVLTVRGGLAPGPAADRVAELLAAGVKLQASVGLECLTPPRRLRPGDTATVNGAELTAGPDGLLVCDRTRLREVSVVVLGGDPDTSTIAARGATAMPAAVTDPPLSDAAPTPDALAAERGRVAEVLRLTAGHPDLTAAAVGEGWTAEDCRRAMLGRVREARPQVSAHHHRPVAPAATGPQAVAAAILCRAGHAVAAEAEYGKELVAGLGRLRSASLPDLCAHALTLDGRDVPHDKSSLIKAAVSTAGTLPTALADAGRVSLEAAYRATPATWRGWAAVRPAADFRPHSTVRPNFFGDLTEVGPAGEVKHGTYRADDAVSWRVRTFAKQLKVARQTLIKTQCN